MNRRNLKAFAHGAAGLTAFATMLAFMAGSVISEFSAVPENIVATKIAIRWGLLLLVPAMAIAGASSVAMVGTHPKGLAGKKLARMRIIAANGLFILVPAALYLAWRAEQGAFDGWFIALQAVEYAAGALNLALMAMNIRDGFRLSGRFRPSPALSASR